MNDTFVKQCCGSGIYGNPGQSIDFSGNGSQNNGNQGGSTVIDDSNYFKVSELLAELNTERKKRIARENLGILLENFATIEDLRDYLKIADLDLSEFLTESDLANYVTREDLEGLGNNDFKMEWSNELNKMKVTFANNDVYVSSAFEKLTAPAAPTISAAYLNQKVITGSVGITVTNNKAGSTLYYSIDGGEYQITGGSFSLQSGFNLDAYNVTKIYVVKVKAIYNGMWSTENTYEVKIYPKCKEGSITVQRNNNNNNYSTQATINLIPSEMFGVANYYSSNGGATWTSFNSPMEISINMSADPEKYQVKTENPGYESAIVKSSSITLNAKKTYFGWSTKENITAEDITTLEGGSVVEANGLVSGQTYNLRTPSTTSYVWIIQTKSINPTSIFHNAADVIPAGFISKGTLEGYNCYRSTELWKAQADTLYLK